MKIYEGKISGEGKRFGIIVSRFNSAIADRLLEGAVDCLIRHGANDEKIEVFKVPGAFEIPPLLKSITARYDGIICLAVLIRGETTHFDLLARVVTRDISHIGIESGVPIGFGIITAETVEQAIDRAGGKRGNKGTDAAMSVMEQIGLRGKLRKKK